MDNGGDGGGDCYRQRLMQHKGNKGQGHKMEPTLRLVQKYLPRSHAGSRGRCEERSLLSEPFMMLPGGIAGSGEAAAQAEVERRTSPESL